jgi:serine/threonine protein kinase/CheY-like chemotaxis protein
MPPSASPPSARPPSFDPIDIIGLGLRSGVIKPAAAERGIRLQREGGDGIAMLLSEGHLRKQQLELLRLADPASRPGLIAGYRIDDTIGLGGMGIVYRAVGGSPRRKVALKVIRSAYADDEHFRRRFLLEAAIGSKLRHPNVVAIHDYGTDGDRLYLAMELVSGGDANSLAAASRGGLPIGRCLSICIDAAAGLEAIHAANLIHRDIKPANLLLTADGRTKVADLGLVRDLEQQEGLTGNGMTPGTPAFMAPEQARKDPSLDRRADIYALGATLYYLITGHYPFAGASEFELISEGLQHPLPDPRWSVPACPASVADIVLRAGRLAREQRYPNAGAMRSAMVDAQRGLPAEIEAIPEARCDPSEETRQHWQAPPSQRSALGPFPETSAIIRAAQSVLSAIPTSGEARILAASRLPEIAARLAPLAAAAKESGREFVTKLSQLTVEMLLQLEAWPDHISPGSMRTVIQALEQMERMLARPDEPQVDLRMARALLVDDDQVSLKTACSAVARTTIAFQSFSVPEQALAAAEQGRFSIVFTDLMMEGMNGFQLAARLRQIPGYRRVPILFVTGINEFEHSFRCSDESANDLIVKPFLLIELSLKTMIYLGVGKP